MFISDNYYTLPTKMKNNRKVQISKSVGKIITSKKQNLSKMNEKLTLLNSDIEDLYKKYAEKKKIRRNKEKSEQYLVSRINFLLEEERKIRTLIENNPLQKINDNEQKITLKFSTLPGGITNTKTLKYKTIESIDDNQRTKINKFKKIKKNKNISLSSGNFEQNKSMENRINNNHNIKNIKNSNVTNNVCIIINNTEKNTLQNHNNNNNYFQDEVTISKNNKNKNIKDIGDININTGEKDKNRLKIEIQNIKMKLASTIADKETISENFYNLDTSEKNEDLMSILSFNRKIKSGRNKNGSRSLKNILNMKRKYLKNLNKEIDLKRINLKTRERSVENRKKKNDLFNFNTNSPNFNYETINNKRSRNKDLIITKNKKSNSKPTLDIINKKTTTIQSPNKKSIYFDNIASIDSNKPTNINNNPINNLKNEIENQINISEYNSINIKNNPNKSISLSNLTFNQSIEKKRKMLGIEINKTINNDINNYLKNIKNKIDINNNNLKENKKKSYINNEEEIILNNEDISNNLITYDALSYPSISNVTNLLENEINKNNANNNRNNLSLMSIVSNKSNKTNKTSIPTRKIKIIKKYFDNSNYVDNDGAHIIKIKNTLNNEIILKKQEKNKGFINSIRIIKKREKNNNKKEEKNNNKEENNDNNSNNNNPINCVTTINYKEKKENKNDVKEKKFKIYNNEIIGKELAVIRRINMKIKEYKNYKPKIKMITERRKNRFKEEKNVNEEEIDNKSNNTIGNYNSNIIKDKNKNSKNIKKYRFKSKERLDEIQKKENNSKSKNNNLYVKKRARSKSNANMSNKIIKNNIRPFRP